MLIDLPSLNTDTFAVIIDIKGGYQSVSKLHSMGIREGKIIKKISGQHFKGPQIIKIDNLQIAVGYGIAKNILLEEKK